MAMLGGMQDQYAATFGGFSFIEFGDGHVIVNPLRVSGDVVNELEHNMLLCYTGATRRSDGVIEDQERATRRPSTLWRCGRRRSWRSR
jgi:D-glycero-alpha-D-manno-heptose-7-phosphate kinase